MTPPDAVPPDPVPPDPTPDPSTPDPVPLDPLKGLRGVYAATLVLESIVVGLALLVLPKFGAGATAPAVAVIAALAVAMLVAAGLQRRPWGLWLAIGLQVAMIACGLLVTALGVLGVLFALVWGGLLLLRRDVAGKLARGELPGQRLPDQR